MQVTHYDYASSPSTAKYQTSYLAQKTYAYRVRTVDANGASSAFTVADIATTFTFTPPDPIVANQTDVKAAHLGELRQAIDMVRVAAGLPAQWTSYTVPPGTDILASQVNEMRTALATARFGFGIPAVTYTYGVNGLVTIGMEIRQPDFQQLREGVK